MEDYMKPSNSLHGFMCYSVVPFADNKLEISLRKNSAIFPAGTEKCALLFFVLPAPPDFFIGLLNCIA